MRRRASVSGVHYLATDNPLRWFVLDVGRCVGPDKDSDKRQFASIEAHAKAVGLEIVATFYDAVRGAERR